MDKPNNDSIGKATDRVKKVMTLEKLRRIPKYRNYSLEDYNRLIKNAEIFAVLILEAYIAVNNSNI